MMHSRTLVGMAVAIALAVLAVPLVQAHELLPEGDAKLQWKAKRFAFMPRDRSLPTANRKPDEYVVVLANRWSLGQPIHVCFYGGNTSLRMRILVVAAEWFQHANLQFDPTKLRDCSPGDTSEIRIGFSEPGYWSYIGTDSLDPYLVRNNLASMNFAGFDFQPIDEPRFTAVVLHEFGHALGFHHEHQSPGTACDAEYDWDKLYAWYDAQYRWPKKMVDDNVRQLLTDVSAYEWSTRDSKSIMVYKSDVRFLLKGQTSKCNFQENIALSDFDREGARRSYPAAGAPQQQRIDRLRRAIAMETNPQTREALVKQLQMLEKLASK